jgi:sucrose phosphorylase
VPRKSPPPAHRNLWDETDVAVITYGDSLLNGEEAPLKTLHGFLTQRLGALVSWVHVLPFHPWTSDDGFAVLDYSSVNEALGTLVGHHPVGRRLSADGGPRAQPLLESVGLV